MKLYVLAAAIGAGFVDLIPLHGPDGQRVFVNPAEISTLREPSATALGGEHFAKGTHCVIVTTNGKYLPVQEDCDEVQTLVSGRKS